MSSNNRYEVVALPRKVLCVALAAAFAGPVMAEEDDEVQRLIKPESSFTLGVGHVSGDNQRFGMFNGLNKEGTYGLGEFSVIRRDDETGTWFRAQGRNLGLPTAELRVEQERQGSWRYFAEVDQQSRTTPYDVHTRLQGIGNNQLNIPAAGAIGIAPDFKLERLGSKLGFNYFFNPELEVSVVFQNQDKKGERLFGRGNAAGPTAQEFLAEPINSTIRQMDVVLNYTGEKLQLSGGYYGSWYLNANNQLNVTNGALAPAFNVIALPPDNFAHQLNLSGGYQFTDKTRGNFKVAYTRAGQTDSFVNLGTTGLTNISGRTDLGGRMDNTLVQAGVTSRPTKELSLLGNVRYENRDDNTAVARYVPASASTTGYNEPRSLKILSGKLEASYLLPQGFRLTGGLDAEQKERSMAGIRVVGYRETTDENSGRVELKRSISESVNGSIAYIHSERTGSGYATSASSNLLQPIYIADRNRDKVRVFMDWTPVDALTLQLAAEQSKDDYGRGRGNPDIGVRTGEATLYSLDATWSLNDNWKLNGWMSRTETRVNQATGLTALTLWTAALNNYVDAYGVGLRGKVTGSFDVGADLLVSKDVSAYRLGGAAASGLPDITYDQMTMKVFGRYAYTKDTSFRLDYIFDHRKTNDWTWNGNGANPRYTYTDGTYLYQRPEDKVHFIGVSMNYAFR